MDFSGKNVLIVGLGTLGGGVGTARFFAKRGANVTVTDRKTEKELERSVQELSSYPIRYVLGKHDSRDFEKADLIIKNPSVPSQLPELAAARRKHIPVDMAESLFMRLAPTKNIIGVTGTRGKSTTSQLIYLVLKKAGKHAVLGGNVAGTSTLELLDEINIASYVVLELSSFMLESFGWYQISPSISVITNIYPDHLNRYPDIDHYMNDKKNSYLFQKKDDYLILNKNNSYSSRFSSDAPSRIAWFAGTEWDPTHILAIPGEHNRENASAALTVANVLGIDTNTALAVITSFTGLPYRLQTVGVIDGVTYINDSASTTPAAGIAALNSFVGNNVILITGGNTKNLPMGEYIDLIVKRKPRVILFAGSARDEFKKIIPLSTIELGDVAAAVQQARKLARAGDIVLFSPACTHLPVVNEFERGDIYNRAVNSFKKTDVS
jgi:UDP-N-acetylmuramoylalanine--D-glutamate ligase